MSEPSTDDAPLLSRAEIDNAIKSLTAAEKTKIVKIAAQYAKMTPYEAEDLYQEALVRVLDGRRKWPRGLPATTFFFCGIMRSIGWEWKRKDDLPDEDNGGEGVEEPGVERIMALFEDDLIAQEILKLMADGARGEDIRKATGLSRTDYESKRRKIRRRIEKFIEKLKTCATRT